MLKTYIRERRPDEEIYHLLFDFVYWMEGQDKPKMAGRFHVVPADQSPCPFDAPEDENESGFGEPFHRGHRQMIDPLFLGTAFFFGMAAGVMFYWMLDR